MKFFMIGLSAEETDPAPPDIYGCTDPNADNYDPDATVDDGSCIYLDTGVFTFPFTFPIQFEEP